MTHVSTCTGCGISTTVKFKKIFTVFCFLLIALISGCAFFEDGNIDKNGKKGGTGKTLTSFRLNKTSATIKAGEMLYISYTTRPEEITIDPEWTYDANIISLEKKQNGVIITGKKEGYTSLTASYDGKSDTAIITVSGFTDSYVDTTEPYIYSSTQYLVMQAGEKQLPNVSLYNGGAEDINGYTWTTEDSAVAQLAPTGQYCQITAKKPGYTRVKITHTKAKLAYYIGVYVFEDVTKTPYITTQNNIITMSENGDEQTISVSLVNAKGENYSQQFVWQIVSGSNVISISANAQKCVITPKGEGEATIRITHPDAPYPFDITARVIRIVKNVYVEPDATRVILNNNTPHELKVKLHGLTEGSDYSPDEFTWEFDKNDIADYYTYGNTIVLTGKKNGSANLYIGHPKAKQKRQVLVIVENSSSGAIDTSCQITTTQNYIKTKEGADETEVTIYLRGGTDGDEQNFSWNILQQPQEAGNDVISLTTTNGTVTSARAARAAASQASTYVLGTAHITPLHEGTAVITLKHPKAYYPTEILVKVLNKGALLTTPLYFSGTGIVKFLNSATYNYKAALLGANKTAADDSAINWESDKSTLHINASGAEAVLSSTASGNTISHITLTHPKAESPKKVLVLTADTQDKLDKMKAFYADKTYYSINVQKTVSLFVNQIGFNAVDDQGHPKPFDFSATTWTTSNPLVATVEKSADNPLGAVVTGVKAGTAIIHAAYSNEASLDFHITVYPANVNLDTVEKTKYLTTTNNVVNLSGNGKSAEVSVTAIGIPESDFSRFTWTSDKPTIATVFPNGNRATIHAIQDGEAVITVHHDDSENELKLYVRVGNQYVIPPTKPTVYIASSADPILLVKDDPIFTLTAALANTSGSEGASGFSFSVRDTDIASITTQYAEGKCFIRPLKAGETELTIHHASAVSDKKILILVANTAEELSAFRHLTTQQNMVTIGEGESTQVVVSVKNSSEAVVSGYSWVSDEEGIAGIVSSSGAMAVIKGNGIGTTKLHVKNDKCKYPLEIIVQVVDQVSAAANPHIHVNNPLITLSVSKSWTELTADLVGGKAGDERMFSWVGANSTIIQCYGQNGKGMVRGLKSGTTYITVSHPKAKYPQPITVVVDDPELKPCSINVSTGNMLSLKPNAGDQTITAQLIGGNETDKYNFKWSLDVYDIVYLDYNANTAIVTPLKEGACTLTIHHPKSAYDQQIRIKVQKYDNFGFGQNNVTVKEGKGIFLQMQIPASSVPTHVQYSTKSPSVIKVGGTDSVCHITGLKGNQTATVTAHLIAANTGIVQSSADLYVAVEESPANEVYLTGATTVYTITKGKSTTISASLVGPGITETDQMNMTWETSNADVARIRGVDSTGKYAGKQCYITAIDGGDCTVTIRHDKSPSPLTYHIIVPQEDAAEVSLSRSYVKITQGRNTEIDATIKNGKNSDYKTLVWEAEEVNNEEIVRVMGNGKTVAIYGIKPGRTKLRCTLPATGVYAECDIVVDAVSKLSFETNAIRVQPGKSRTIKYLISPQTASITWLSQSASGDQFVTYTDHGNTDGNGTVTITGIKEGISSLIATSSSGNSATLQAICAWDYVLNIIGNTTFKVSPEEKLTLGYSVSPASAVVHVTSSESDLFDYSISTDSVTETTKTGTITITPKTESPNNVVIKIYGTNPNKNNEEFEAKTIQGKFQYRSLTPEISFVSRTVSSDGSKTARFSSYENGFLKLSDGERVTLKTVIKEKKANAEISYNWIPAESGNADIKAGADSDGKFQVWSETDVVEDAYKIVTGYAPAYKGIKRDPFMRGEFAHRDVWAKSAFQENPIYWDSRDHHRKGTLGWYYSRISNDFVFQRSYDGIYKNNVDSISWGQDGFGFVNGWGSVRDPSLDGKFIPAKEIKNYVWFYCPGASTNNSELSISVEAGFWPESMMGNKLLYCPITPDTTIVATKRAGTLEIFATTGAGKKKLAQIIVSYEKRLCRSYDE